MEDPGSTLVSLLRSLLSEAQAGLGRQSLDVDSLQTKASELQSVLVALESSALNSTSSCAALKQPQTREKTLLCCVPVEVAERILAFVPPTSVLKLRRLSKQFNAMILSQPFIARNLRTYLGHSVTSSPPFGRASRLFEDCARHYLAWPAVYQRVFTDLHLYPRTTLHWAHKNSIRAGAPIPICIARLASSLVELDLSYCKLAGEIPSEVFELRLLESLQLHENGISGVLKADVGRLMRLRVLNLHSNQISGFIPAELYTLTELRYLNLGHNCLDGLLDASIGRLELLRVLYLNHNHINGGIPQALGSLTNLEYVSLCSNELCGPIPIELAEIAGLVSCNLKQNVGLTFDEDSDVISF
ncbi:hypothetical protein BC830DRAFT_1231539 [Chytriomyces sp. MP71]|nr:hypothetical protein BC830DRAFT_1231539 [Chytriomyces sp. MP71]